LIGCLCVFVDVQCMLNIIIVESFAEFSHKYMYHFQKSLNT
jgi:hypothetical protein